MTAARSTTMTEDYLKVIWKAQEWSEKSITTNEIAATLGVAASSVSGNLKKLARDGFIDYEPYGRIDLSETGRALALTMVRRHRLIETYLVEQMGYSWDEVHDEAEVLEHAISDRLLNRWDEVLGHPARDPHGDPIPRQDGTMVRPPAALLQDFADGQCGVIVRVSDDDPELLRYLDTLHLAVGVHVRVEAHRAYAGTISVVRTSHQPGSNAAGSDATAEPITEASFELAAVVATSIWATTDPADDEHDGEHGNDHDSQTEGHHRAE